MSRLYLLFGMPGINIRTIYYFMSEIAPTNNKLSVGRHFSESLKVGDFGWHGSESITMMYVYALCLIP